MNFINLSEEPATSIFGVLFYTENEAAGSSATEVNVYKTT